MPLPDWATDPEVVRGEVVAIDGVTQSPPIRPQHGSLCASVCAELAVRSPLERDRPPSVRCNWCGALPGVACTWRAPGGRVRPLTVYGRFHPSRLQEARAA